MTPQKECIIPQEQYLFLFKSASLTIISVVYASYQQYYDISLNAFIVFCTSINYWRKPMNDWRRTMDKSCLFVYVLYFFYRANNLIGMIKPGKLRFFVRWKKGFRKIFFGRIFVVGDPFSGEKKNIFKCFGNGNNSVVNTT